MALDAYLTLTAAGGLIEGSVTQLGREGWIRVDAVHHEVDAPRDSASAMMTGRRQHQPIVVTKAVDRSSPLLMNALVHNDLISDWKLEFWRPSAKGPETNFYTIELVDVAIGNIRTEYAESMSLPVQEHVSFWYQQITWTHVESSVTADDNWLMQ